MKNILFVSILAFVSVGCQKLDSFMFSNIELQEYKLDGFTEDVDFILNDNYTIESSRIHELTFESGSNNDLIYGFYLGDIENISTDTVIMYCHGNYGHMDYYWQRAKALANIGAKHRYGVLMVDYKGYGMSEGEPTEEGLVEDVNEGLKWLKDNGLTSDRLIIYGFSLGSYPSTYLSSTKEGELVPSKLILEAPFASNQVMVHDASKLAMSNNYFTTTNYANADLIKDVEQPFLLIHGTEDAFLALETHGQVVYDNYSGVYSRFEKITGAGHSTIPQIMYDAAYEQIYDGNPTEIDVENYTELLLDFITHNE